MANGRQLERVDVLLSGELREWLDHQALQARAKTGKRVSRSELIRFLLTMLQNAGESVLDYL